MMANRLPVYCEQYPAIIPPTTAPQLEMMAISEVSDWLKSLLSCRKRGRRSCEAWERKLKPVIKQTVENSRGSVRVSWNSYKVLRKLTGPDRSPPIRP